MMKNLNEQLERIEKLFNYKVGVLISEQETPILQNISDENVGLTYLITAGANNNPMRSETLNKFQGFPVPKNVKPNDVYLYEIKLSDALNDDFSKAKILNKLDEKNKDQIIFGDQSIINTGTIRIPINQNTVNQTIKVSGNGALVLSRAMNEYNEINKLGGMMILELSAKKLYSNKVSLEELGITQPNLIAKVNSVLNGLIYQLNNDKGKTELDPTYENFIVFPDKYWVSIKDLDGKTIFSNTKWSDKISNFKGTIDRSNFKSKLNIISKTIKTDIITPGLNQLMDTVSSFISEKLPTIPKDILDKFILFVNNIIKSTDDKINVEYIKKYIETNSYTKKEIIKIMNTQKPEIKNSDNKYKEGHG
jgi:hypothetical protein